MTKAPDRGLLWRLEQDQYPNPLIGKGRPRNSEYSAETWPFNMFLIYIDDSGTEQVRCFSALVIHETKWREAQQQSVSIAER